MPTLAVALLSGGLDSILAIRILQEQGVEVQALNFRTQFACCRETAAQAARQLGVQLTVLGTEDAYLDVIRRPRFGYGRGANPCVDCRIFMFERAQRFMEEIGASVVVSGEVLGQRPMSQKRRDLMVIAKHSGLEGRLLRPLSALLLPATLAEQNGEIDRQRLFGFSGRSRKGLISLANSLGIPDTDIPSPSTGCMLTQQSFAPRVHDLVRLDPGNSAWDFALLKVGRHVRFDSQTKMVIGRRESENEMLRRAYLESGSRAEGMLNPENFAGPTILVVGPATPQACDFAGALLLRFCHFEGEQSPRVEFQTRQRQFVREVSRQVEADAALTL